MWLATLLGYDAPFPASCYVFSTLCSDGLLCHHLHSDFDFRIRRQEVGKERHFHIWNSDLFCTSKKKESVFFICNSYMALRMGRGAFKASCVICKGGNTK